MEKVGVKVVVIGGGTGSFTLLSSLKQYVRDLTALVNMADDGGSTGILRDELGVLPPGDIRQCLVALSQSPKVRELFNYRFDSGTFSGHAFGNLFLTALEKLTGSFAEAVETAGEVLNVVGRVEPITLDKVTLVMETANGEVVRGEHVIGDADFASQRPLIRLEPVPRLNPAAAQAIAEAELVVIAPGNLYTSLAPALVVPGMHEALMSTRAKKVYVCNLVTKPGQTDGFLVEDFAAEIERFADFKLDYVLYNDTKPDDVLLKRYAHENEYWVEYDETTLKAAHYKARGSAFVSREFKASNSGDGDPIAHTRTYIRHDADTIARALMKIYFS